MRKSLSTVGAAVLLSLLSVGCMSESKYRQLENDWRRANEQIAERDARIAELQSEINLLKEGPARDRSLIESLTAENEGLRARLDELQKQYEGLAARGPETIVLDPATDKALKEFASQNPDLVEYDPLRGMLKFRSDVTFDLGSADLRSTARESLGQLAEILNQPAAKGYELRIVGHTDSVRISKAETLRKHPTNWHLSAHRAISVKDALEGAGVSSVRMMIGGYGMYRPAAPNATGGAEPNRRVEIYLVGMTPVNESFLNEDSGSGSGRPSPASSPEPSPEPSTDEPSQPDEDMDSRIPPK